MTYMLTNFLYNILLHYSIKQNVALNLSYYFTIKLMQSPYYTGDYCVLKEGMY